MKNKNDINLYSNSLYIILSAQFIIFYIVVILSLIQENKNLVYY